FLNFLCLLGWSPKNDREKLSHDEIVELFTLEGINRANAVVNFTEEDPFDAKALWLNAEHIRSLPPDDLARDLLPFVGQAGSLRPIANRPADLDTLRKITPLIQE